MILSVISWYRLVRSAKDLWAGAAWGMGGLRDARAKAFLSPGALVTDPAPPFSSSFPATPAVAAETWKRGIYGVWSASAGVIGS